MAIIVGDKESADNYRAAFGLSVSRIKTNSFGSEELGHYVEKSEFLERSKRMQVMTNATNIDMLLRSVVGQPIKSGTAIYPLIVPAVVVQNSQKQQIHGCRRIRLQGNI